MWLFSIDPINEKKDKNHFIKNLSLLNYHKIKE